MSEKEVAYLSFNDMRKGHEILNREEILQLGEESLIPFLEEEEWEDEIEGAYLSACMDSGRAIEEVLQRHNLHVITESMYDSDEEDEDGHVEVTSVYQTGFHWVNRERYYLCRKKHAAILEETF